MSALSALMSALSARRSVDPPAGFVVGADVVVCAKAVVVQKATAANIDRGLFVVFIAGSLSRLGVASAPGWRRASGNLLLSIVAAQPSLKSFAPSISRAVRH